MSLVERPFVLFLYLGGPLSEILLYVESGIYVESTVEPPNKGHIGRGTFVPYSEVAPISEVPIKLSCIPLIDHSDSYLSLMS